LNTSFMAEQHALQHRRRGRAAAQRDRIHRAHGLGRARRLGALGPARTGSDVMTIP
jgi:hypothetical protein